MLTSNNIRPQSKQSEKNNNMPENLAYALFSGDGTQENPSHLEFNTWYHPDICHYLLQMADNHANCIRVTFPDSGFGNNTETFEKQITQLVLLSNNTKKIALFVSKEPGAEDHFVLGLVKGNKLLFIDPVGMTAHKDIYKVLAKLQKNNILSAIGFSVECLQKAEFEGKGSFSCGAFVSEMGCHFLTSFSEDQFNQFFDEAFQSIALSIDNSTALKYVQIKIKSFLPPMLLDVLNANNAEQYRQKVLDIRQKHANQLETLPVVLANEKKISVKEFLEKCKEEAPAQVVFLLLLTDKNIIDIQNTIAYKNLKQELISSYALNSRSLAMHSNAQKEKQKEAIEISPKTIDSNLALQNAYLKYSIFISTAHRDSQDEQAGTGDVDYARALAFEANERLLKSDEPGAQAIQGLFTEEAVYEHVWKHAAGPNSILHVMINSPKTGYAFSVEGLKKFKAQGGRVIITAVEFYKYIKDEYRKETLEYLSEAEDIIFLDELDKKDAIKSLEVVYPQGGNHDSKIALLRQHLGTARVIPVPPTIPPIAVPYQQRGPNILVFGMIRFGKGFAHVIKLAELFKNSEHFGIKNKKILVVGSVQEHDKKNRELHRLMKAIYPSKTVEIEKATTSELKELLKVYQPDSKLVSQLPIELHIDVPINQLAPLFNRCKYAFLPAYRGASLRNSSISSALAQPFVIFTHHGDITPSVLQKGGEYQDAMVLIESDSYQTYADNVLKNLMAREENPALNITTLKAVSLLMNTLSREAVIQKHLVLYKSLIEDVKLKPALLEPKTKAQIKAEQIAFNWMLKTQANRSDKLMKKMTDFDVRALGEKNYKNLLARLKNLAGSLTAEMKLLIQKNRKVDEILTPQEKQFFAALLVDSAWTLKHVTPHLKEIKQGGNVMLSVEQRRRQTKKEVANSHTNPAEGHLDNVFFSFGPGDFETVRFLDYVEDVIVGDVAVLAKQENSSLKNMWSSDHFYAYATEQKGERVNIYGTTYNVNYRLILGKEKEAEPRWVKECEFVHPDGQVYTQVVEKGEEIFTYPRLDIALVLLTIEKIRLLGKEAYQAIMQETDLAIRQSILHTFYHSGVHEVHKPVRFKINQRGVTIQKKASNKYNPFVPKPYVVEFHQSCINLIKDVLKGKSEQVLPGVGKTIDVRQSFYIEAINITLLGAAILSGNIRLVQILLEEEANLNLNIDRTGTNCDCIGYAVEKNYIEFTPIECVALMSDQVQAYKLFEKLFPGEKIDFQENFKAIPEILKLLLDKKGRSKKNPKLIHLNGITGYELEIILRKCKPSNVVVQILLNYSSIPSKELPIVRAVATGSIEIVDNMLQRGAKLTADMIGSRNAHIYTDLILPSGCTPLFAAVYRDDLTMCDFLLKSGADINEKLTTPYKETKMHEHEGFTALLLAVELGNINMVQWLLTQKANIRHRDIHGRTVLHLAKKNNNTKMLEMLRTFLQAHPIPQEEIESLEKSIDVSVEFKIKHHRYFGVLSYINKENGERFFIDSADVSDQTRIELLPFNSDTTLEMLKEGLLEFFNSGLVMGVGEEDFSITELGSLKFESMEEQVSESATIVSIEIINAKKLAQLPKIIENFRDSKFIELICGKDIKSLSSKDKACIELNTSWYSGLAVEVLNVIACMDNNIRAFSSHEQAVLQRQYQQAYAKQYALIDAIRKDDSNRVTKFLEEGALVRQKALVVYEIKDLTEDSNENVGPSLTPFEMSVLYSQYAIAHLIFDKLTITEHDYINMPFIKKIVRDGELELYKKLHKKEEFNTIHNFHCMFQIAVDYSQVALAKYIFSHLSPEQFTDLQKNGVFSLNHAIWGKPKSLEMFNFIASYASIEDINTGFESVCNSNRFIAKPEDDDSVKNVVRYNQEMFESLLLDKRLQKLKPEVSNKALKIVIDLEKFNLLEVLLVKGSFKEEIHPYMSCFAFESLSLHHPWLKDIELTKKMLKLFISKNGQCFLIAPFFKAMIEKKILPLPQLIDTINDVYQEVAPHLIEIRMALENGNLEAISIALEKNNIVVDACFFIPKERLLSLNSYYGSISPGFESPQDIAHRMGNPNLVIFLHKKGFVIPTYISVYPIVDRIIEEQSFQYLTLLKTLQHFRFNDFMQELVRKRDLHFYDKDNKIAKFLNEWEKRQGNDNQNQSQSPLLMYKQTLEDNSKEKVFHSKEEQNALIDIKSTRETGKK